MKLLKRLSLGAFRDSLEVTAEARRRLQNSEKRTVLGPQRILLTLSNLCLLPMPFPWTLQPGSQPLPGALATYRPDLLDETALYRPQPFPQQNLKIDVAESPRSSGE